MCKKQTEKDESANVQTTNLGLVNLESTSAGAGSMGVFEIVAVVMCVMFILLCCHYCNRRFRKRRQRELHDAVQGGLNGNVGFRTSGAARGPAGVPMVTFSDPGVRSVALTPPSAPMLPALPTPKAAVLPALQQGLNLQPAERIGLWEQCR